MASIIVVDDQDIPRATFARILRSGGHEVQTARGRAELIEHLESAPADLVLLDIHLPDGRGDQLIPDLVARDPYLQIVAVSGDSSVETAVAAIKQGAYEYLTKPFHPETLLNLARHALSERSARVDRALTRAAETRDTISTRSPLHGRSPTIGRVNREIRRLAEAGVRCVGLTGEAGVGKTLAARSIHDLGPRATARFTVYDPLDRPAAAVDTELFGGGGVKGVVELVQGGTLLLKNVERLSSDSQARLLRLVEDGSLSRGRGRPRQLDLAVLVATRAPFDAIVRAGRLSPELGARLQREGILIPPLRERPEDIPPTARALLEIARVEVGLPPLEFAHGIIDFLSEYPWPGNVREIENVIARLAMLSQGGIVDERALRLYCFDTASASFFASGLGEEAVPTLADVERDHLLRTLRRYNSNITHCARALAISRSTLQRKLRTYRLDEGLELDPDTGESGEYAAAGDSVRRAGEEA